MLSFILPCSVVCRQAMIVVHNAVFNTLVQIQADVRLQLQEWAFRAVIVSAGVKVSPSATYYMSMVKARQLSMLTCTKVPSAIGGY
jgi:hypothetical protein